MPAGGSLKPASAETVAAREHFLRQNGRTVFKFAVSQMAESVERLLQRNGLTTADIAVVIPHQANQRILDAAADHLGLPQERMASVIARYGNTTAATLPLALEDVVRAGRLTRGDLVVFVAVGAGFTVGATLVRWAMTGGNSGPGELRPIDRRQVLGRQLQLPGPHAVQRVLHAPRTRNHDDRG